MLGMAICNKCCKCILQKIDITLSTIERLVNCIKCQLESLACSISGNSNQLRMVYASLASENPMAVAAEYPSQTDTKVTYTTNKVRFLDMLNPNMVVLFKGTFNTDLPVYFKDTSNYEHIVTIGDTTHQATANELVNNYPYPALYIGNYIILNPTEATLQAFKEGQLQ